jgi:hypothetical protein
MKWCCAPDLADAVAVLACVLESAQATLRRLLPIEQANWGMS